MPSKRDDASAEADEHAHADESWVMPLERAQAALLRRRGGSLADDLARALGLFAGGLRTDRAYLARPHATGSWTVRAEWMWARTSASTPTCPHEFKLLDRWSTTLDRGKAFHTSAAALAAGERTAHNLGTFAAIAFAPIRSGSSIYGAFVLEHDREVDPWTPGQLSALRVLASVASEMISQADEPRARARSSSRGEASGDQVRARGRSVTRDEARGDELRPRRRASSRSEASAEALLRPLVDAIPAMICWKDRQLRYRGCNAAFAREIGLASPGAIFGRRADELPGPCEGGEQAEAVRARERAILEGEPAELRVCARASAAPGTERWLEVSRAPIVDGRGRVVGIVSLFTDVSERIEHETLLQRGRRLEALGALASGLEHDLSAIVTEIDETLTRARDRLDASPPDPEAVVDELDAIERSSLRAGMLGRQLRHFARRQLVSPQEVSLGELVDSLRDQLERTVEGHARLSIVPTSSRCLVAGDPRLLEQLVVNLVTHARDALAAAAAETPEILVEVTSVALDAAGAERLGLTPGEYALLRVHDPGEGVDLEVADRAFDPYHSTRIGGPRGARVFGAGLGLSVAHGIVTQAGGAIRLVGGRGTTAEVYLPRSFVRARPSARGLTPHGAETVAIVLERPRLRQAVASLLRSLGYRVLTASSLESLLARIAGERKAPPVHLVLSDAPARGRASAHAREISERLPQARIVFMAGRRELPPSGAGDSGEITWLSKPFSLEALAAAVRESLEGR